MVTYRRDTGLADREPALNEKGALDLDDVVLIETRLLVRYDDGWRALP